MEECMGVHTERNADKAGVLDLEPYYKTKVCEIYPHAYCLKNQRHVYHVRDITGHFSSVVRYQFEIIIDDKGNKISTSTYSEEGAWQYAWEYIEDKMLEILEN